MGCPLQTFVALHMTFAEINNVNHSFSRRQRMAGKDWMMNFIKRHHLAVRIPQSTSMNRVLAFESGKVDRFFSLLKSVHDQEHIEPRHIFNLEESRVTSVPEPGTILAIKGRKQSRSNSKWGERSNCYNCRPTCSCCYCQGSICPTSNGFSKEAIF